MLEHVPAWLGKALGSVRAGAGNLAVSRMDLPVGLPGLDLTSPAFADGARLPERFTADGAGVSPPLVWTSPPPGTARLALLVEDADAPAPQPLVHAVLWDIPATVGRLAEGAITQDGGDAAEGEVGRNSYLRTGWLPPDPPTGHGAHRYVFQLFALDGDTAALGETPGRTALLEVMAGHVLAAGTLIGTYSRGEAAPVDAVATMAVAG